MKLIYKILIVTGLFIGLAYSTAITRAEAPIKVQGEVETNKELTVEGYITLYSSIYGSNKEELMKVARCESNLKQTAIGDNGKAKGIFQYHTPTWLEFERQFRQDLDIESYADQSKLTAWAFSKGEKYKRHWTCYTMLYGK